MLLRVDLNVPVDADGNILDDTRIRRIAPTVNYCLDEEAKVIIMSHMDRPGGKRVKRYSLRNVAKRLARYISRDVKFVSDCIGPGVERAVRRMKEGEVLCLENLRFYKGETDNSTAFAKALASLGDVYINDAFAVSHREHASIVSVPRFVKERGAGFLMRKEINYFKRALDNPRRPFCAIIGGGKVASKIRAIEHLVGMVDKLLIGGGMSFTFLRAMGFPTGQSLVEEKAVPLARRILTKAHRNNVKIYLPVDCVVADKVHESAKVEVVPSQEIPEKWYGVDIGPATVTLFAEALRDARTIVWNGPMGIFEVEPFARGTLAMVSTLARSYAMTIVGGGDTDVAIHRAGEWANISYISTGGGAFIHLLEGRELPGIRALR